MSVNGINGAAATEAYTSYVQSTPGTMSQEKKEETKETAAEVAAVYEKSEETESKSTAKIYKPNQEMVDKLKAAADAQTAQLRSIVEKLITGQSTAFANANDMWSFLAKGDFEVDAQTKAQAQADIAEDGYWGVDQTSSRIIDFANALTGGDPNKIEEMRDAFKKGYEQAEKTWGGELPEISKQTYEAVMKKFDELAEAAGTNA